MASNLNTRLTTLVVGAAVTLAAGTVGYFAGTVRVRDAINFTPNGTTTGAVVKLNGVTQDQIFTFPLSNTGGLSKYDTGISASPLTTTGTITEIAVSCGANPKPFAYDLGFVKARNTATGAGILNLNNKTTATGATQAFLTGSLLWNPADFLKLGTLTSVPTTSGNDCQVRIRLFDTYGE